MPATIVLADSEKSTLELATAVLTRHGFIVLPASHAREALEHLKQSTAEVVICAETLEDMRGHELATEVKAQAASTRVVLYTNQHHDADEPCVDAKLATPFRFGPLRALLVDWGLLEATAGPTSELSFGIPSLEISPLEFLAPVAPPETLELAAAAMTGGRPPSPSLPVPLPLDLPRESLEAAAPPDDPPEFDVTVSDGEEQTAQEQELSLESLVADPAGIDCQSSEADVEVDLQAILAAPQAPAIEATHEQTFTATPRQVGPTTLPPSLPKFGDLSTMPLPRLLFELYVATFSGRLVLERQKVRRTIYVWGGFPVKVDSAQLSENLGQLLLEHGRITHDQYEQAQALVENEGLDQGAALLRLGALGSADLLAALTEQTEQKLANSLAWRDGTYAIELGQNLVENQVMTEVPPLKAIWRGVREHYDLASLMRYFEGLRQRFVVGTNLFQVHFHTLGPFLRDLEIGALLDGQHTFEQALRSNDGRAMEIAQMLYVLLVTDMIRPSMQPGAPTTLQTQDGAGTAVNSPQAQAGLADYREITRICDAVAQQWLDTKDKNHFDVLGIGIDASTEEVLLAYDAKIKESLTVRLPAGLPEDIVRRAREVQDKLLRAKSTLEDPTARRQYCARLGLSSVERAATDHSARQAAIDGEKLFLQGKAQLEQGDVAAAMKSFQDAVKHSDNEPTYRVGLGRAILASGPHDDSNVREAAMCFQQALQLDPSHVEGNVEMARAMIQLGAGDTAKPFLYRALQKSPIHQQARQLLAAVEEELQ